MGSDSMATVSVNKAERAVRAMQELSDASAVNGVCNLRLMPKLRHRGVQRRLMPKDELLRRN